MLTHTIKQKDKNKIYLVCITYKIFNYFKHTSSCNKVKCYLVDYFSPFRVSSASVVGSLPRNFL